MDVMQLRRMLMSLGVEDMARSKSGTFTGDGTASVILDIGFEPDVVVINSNLQWNVAGYTGLINVLAIKGVAIDNACHTSNTATNLNGTLNVPRTGQDPWGANCTSNNNYCTYSDGKLTVTNYSPTAERNYFVNNQQYEWTAYKA